MHSIYNFYKIKNWLLRLYIILELIDLFIKKYIQYPTEQCPYLKFFEIQGAGDEDGALIRPEEGGILLVVLVLWVTSIALFINR